MLSFRQFFFEMNAGHVRGDIRRGAGIFFTDGKAFLGLRYPHNYLNGSWTIPGGHLKAGESFEHAARREAKEECGHTEGREIGKVVQPDGRWVGYVYQVSHRFNAKLSDEHVAWKWIEFSKIRQYRLLPVFKKHLGSYIKIAKDHCR